MPLGVSSLLSCYGAYPAPLDIVGNALLVLPFEPVSTLVCVLSSNLTSLVVSYWNIVCRLSHSDFLPSSTLYDLTNLVARETQHLSGASAPSVKHNIAGRAPQAGFVVLTLPRSFHFVPFWGWLPSAVGQRSLLAALAGAMRGKGYFHVKGAPVLSMVFFMATCKHACRNDDSLAGQAVCLR